MKKLLFSALSAIIAILLIVFLLLPYVFGMRAQSALEKQFEIIKNNGLLTVESHQYERGWFSSTETTVIRLKPTLLANAGHYLPDNLKTVLSDPITVVNHVKHGPFSGSLKPVAAEVDSEIRYTAATAKALQRFFGNQAPFSMHNTIGLSGSGSLKVTVPAFEYEELSGIKLSWKGLNGTTEYSKDWQTYQNHYLIPELAAKLADKGDVLLRNVSINTNTYEGKNQLALGDSKVSVEQFSLQWHDNINYQIKLNELLKIVTDLQIGAFINPTGDIQPSNISVKNFHFNTQMNENDKWINSNGQFGFQEMVYGNDHYGPLDIKVRAEHINAAGLLALKHKLAEIADKKMTEDEIQTALIQTAKNEASSLFTDNPKLILETFDFKMPQGNIRISGNLGFNGLIASDMNHIGTMLKKTKAELDFNLPQKLLEDFAVSQARSLFSVNPEDEATGRANLNDINETLRLMVDGTVQSMKQEGYLNVSQGNVSSHVELDSGSLKMNGKPFTIEPDVNEFPEAEDLSQPESAVSSASAVAP